MSSKPYLILIIALLTIDSSGFTQSDSTKSITLVSINPCFTSYFIQEGSVYFDPYAMMSAIPPSGPEKVRGADPKTLKYIRCNFVKDKNRVYHLTNAIPVVDVETFGNVEGDKASVFFCDKDFVYNSEGKLLKNSDSKTFKRLNQFYFCDKNQLYVCSHIDNNKGVIVKNADINSYEIVGDIFLVSNALVFRLGEVVKDVDPYTYQPLEKGYGYDKNALFYRENRIEADIATFNKLLAGELKSEYSWVEDSYYCDKNSIYLEGKILEGASPTSYEIPKAFYLISNGNVFFKGEEIEGIDISTFDLLSTRYNIAKDKNHVYYENTILEKADAATFKMLLRGFAYDKNYLFVDGKVLTIVDGTPIKELCNERLYYDDGYVYILSYSSAKLEGKTKVDGKTLRKYTTDYYKDKDHVYYYSFGAFSAIDGANPASFEMIDDSRLAKDNGGLYYKGRKTASIDGNSFSFFNKNGYIAKDDSYLYYLSNTDEIKCKIKVDGKTLVQITYGFYKDKDKIYHYDYQGRKSRFIVLKGADQETFKVKTGNFAEDKNYEYYNGKRKKRTK